MEERLFYRGVLEAEYPSEWQGRKNFDIQLMADDEDNEAGFAEVGSIHGSLYIPDKSDKKTYEDVVEDADDYSEDEGVILLAVVNAIGEKMWKKKAPVRPISIYRKRFSTPIAAIDRLYIHPQYRGEGYAREAMSKISEILNGLFALDRCDIGLVARSFELGEKDVSNPQKENIVLAPVERDGWLSKFYEGVGFSKVDGPLNVETDIFAKISE